MVSKEQGQKLAQEIKQAVEEILKREGLSLETTKLGYGEWFEYKIKAVSVELGPNGVNLASPEAIYYTKFGFTAHTYDENATPAWSVQELTAPLGTQIQVKGQTLSFAGIAPQRRKYPIAMLDQAGEMVFISEAMVARLNNASQAVAS